MFFGGTDHIAIPLGPFVTESASARLQAPPVEAQSKLRDTFGCVLFKHLVKVEMKSPMTIGLQCDLGGQIDALHWIAHLGTEK